MISSPKNESSRSYSRPLQSATDSICIAPRGPHFTPSSLPSSAPPPSSPWAHASCCWRLCATRKRRHSSWARVLWQETKTVSLCHSRGKCHAARQRQPDQNYQLLPRCQHFIPFSYHNKNSWHLWSTAGIPETILKTYGASTHRASQEFCVGCPETSSFSTWRNWGTERLNNLREAFDQ